jgi:hypothetical protein
MGQFQRCYFYVYRSHPCYFYMYQLHPSSFLNCPITCLLLSHAPITSLLLLHGLILVSSSWNNYYLTTVLSHRLITTQLVYLWTKPILVTFSKNQLHPCYFFKEPITSLLLFQRKNQLHPCYFYIGQLRMHNSKFSLGQSQRIYFYMHQSHSWYFDMEESQLCHNFSWTNGHAHLLWMWIEPITVLLVMPVPFDGYEIT